MDDLWHYRWRIVLYGYHRTPRAEAITVDSVAELAAIIRASQRDPDVNRREHFRVREWIGPEPPHDCPSGITGWGTNNTHTRPCRCGTDHRIYRCGRCRIEVELPTRGPGCGELHWAPSN